MRTEQLAARKLWEAVNAWRGGFNNGPVSRFCAAALDEFKQAVVAGARREAFDAVVRDARGREAETVSSNREACWAFGVLAKVAERLRDAVSSTPPAARGESPAVGPETTATSGDDAAITIKAETRLTGTWWRVRSLLLSLGEDERREVLRGLGICLRCGADEAEIPSGRCTCARDE